MTPGCTGKHWYTSAVQAWRVIRHNRIWRGQRKVRVLGVYRCAACGRWHIGKSFKNWDAWMKYKDE
jgi:hypothetical protein